MSQPSFASTGDTAEKTVTFREIGRDLYAFTAEGDPNTGVVVGPDSVLVIDAQATPVMARTVVEKIRTVTDKPIKHVLLTHYHAVRVLGASGYGASEVISSRATRDLIVERGQEDWDSELGRFPRLFRAAESVPGLTWPTLTFEREMSLWLGHREVRIAQIGRGHTAGDTIAHVPDAGIVFSGDLVEYHSACYCGDAHFTDWPGTLDRLAALAPEAVVPGRGDAVVGRESVGEAIGLTRDFLETLYGSVRTSAARGLSLKEAYDRCHAAMAPRFGSFAIFEHCMPFNVARAFDEARGIAHPRVWTAERDRDMWAALRG